MFLTRVGPIPAATVLAPVEEASLLSNRGGRAGCRSTDSPWFLLGGLVFRGRRVFKSRFVSGFRLDIGTLVCVVSLLLAFKANDILDVFLEVLLSGRGHHG